MQLKQAGHVCGDMRDIIDGRPTGAIRVSIGYMTTKENIDSLLGLIFNSWIKPFNVCDTPYNYFKMQNQIMRHCSIFDVIDKSKFNRHNSTKY